MVVMPEYLKISSKQSSSKPRIISEVKKNCLSKLKLGFTASLEDPGKAKHSGELLWKKGNSEWALRLAEVRHGSLILAGKDTSAVDLRLPLRELNLRPCNAPRTFCLTESKGHHFFMFQALTDDDYEKWVRILAVELIRQTPLQNVRFLDILSIIRHKEQAHESGRLRRGRSEECLTGAASGRLWERARCLREPQSTGVLDLDLNYKRPRGRDTCDKKTDRELECFGEFKKIKIQSSMPAILEMDKGKLQRKWLRTQSMNNLSANSGETSDESGISSGDEARVDLMSRNLDEFSFVPVRERKKFFESLNSGREADFQSDDSSLSRSSSIGNLKHAAFDRFKLRKRKRTKSLHDLRKTPVKEICQMFESRDDPDQVRPEERTGVAFLTERRLQRGERKLDKLRSQIADVEENINVITNDLNSIGKWKLKRQEGLELHVALQRRLDEEKSRLERLMEETARVIKGNQRIIMKLERNTNKPNSSISPPLSNF